MAGVFSARIALTDDVWVIVIAVIAGLVVLLLVLGIVGRIFAARRRRRGLEADAAFPVDGPMARDLAVGLLTITDNVGRWNDPDAKLIAASPGLVKTLRKQWGIDDAGDWMANIQRLVTDRRRSEPRDTLLALRWDVAQRTGEHPYYRQWLDAIKAEGGSTKGENRDVLFAVTNVEDRMEKYGKPRVLPAGTTIRDVYAFAYSQAIALAVWGVAMGVATRDEALQVVQQVSERARSEYGSWEEYGRSVLLGRAMFLGRGTYDKKRFDSTMTTALTNYVAALNPDSTRPGPWSYLPW